MGCSNFKNHQLVFLNHHGPPISVVDLDYMQLLYSGNKGLRCSPSSNARIALVLACLAAT